jgi:hypothetical protein
MDYHTPRLRVRRHRRPEGYLEHPAHEHCGALDAFEHALIRLRLTEGTAGLVRCWHAVIEYLFFFVATRQAAITLPDDFGAFPGIRLVRRLE